MPGNELHIVIATNLSEKNETTLCAQIEAAMKRFNINLSETNSDGQNPLQVLAAHKKVNGFMQLLPFYDFNNVHKEMVHAAIQTIMPKDKKQQADFLERLERMNISVKNDVPSIRFGNAEKASASGSAFQHFKKTMAAALKL